MRSNMKKSAGKYSDIQGNSGSTPDYVLISVLVTALHIFKFYSIVYKNFKILKSSSSLEFS